MAGQKFLAIVSGKLKEVFSVQSSAGAADAGKVPALDAAGRLDNSMMPVGIGTDSKQVLASEALSAGDFVNIYNNAGTANARKADATTTGKECVGFVLSAVSSGATATVLLEGTNTARTGLTPGGEYVLATTAGSVVLAASAPSTAGNVYQKVGIALSATELSFEPSETIEIA